MKVLHLHKLTGVSGSEGHLLALLPALRERGVDARLLGLDVPGTDAALFYERLEQLGSRTVVPAAGSTSRRGSRATSSAQSAPNGPTSCTRISSTGTCTDRSPGR